MVVEMSRIFWQNVELQQRILLQQVDSLMQYNQTIGNNNVDKSKSLINLSWDVMDHPGFTQERVNQQFVNEKCYQKLIRY